MTLNYFAIWRLKPYLKQILSASDFFYTLKAESDISIMLYFIQNAMDFSIICLRRIKSHTCRKHFQVLFSFFTYHRVCDQSNTMGATSGAGTAYPSGTPEFTLVFSEVRVARSLVFCVVFCRWLFAFFLLAIVLYDLLQFTEFNFLFGNFKFFLFLQASPNQNFKRIHETIYYYKHS